MQETILTTLSKWFSNLDFSLTKQNNKLSLICKKLNIKIENLPKEEFIATAIEQGITGVEKLFNSKVLGIDLRELFGVKKKEVKKEESKKEPVSNFEKWIKEELEKAHKNGEFGKVTDPAKNMQDLLEYWKTQKYYFPDYRLEFPKFPWNEIICLVNE